MSGVPARLHPQTKRTAEHSEVYSELRQILLPHARKLDCRTDDGVTLYVDTRHVQKNHQRQFFAAVRMGKAYVSHHLMPVYVLPEPMSAASADLGQHMHGKSCFNVTALDAARFQDPRPREAPCSLAHPLLLLLRLLFALRLPWLGAAREIGGVQACACSSTAP